ncbi:MAG: response regulator [Solirubrobacterales bacterium]|nr:response regulator [Solirubrobacterales bacterium]
MSRILTIEDSASIRLLLVRRLEMAGHTVDAAPSPRAALEMIEINPPDLVLLDLGLPGDGGIPALPEIRAAIGEVPIVLLSARSDLDRVEVPVPVAGRVRKPIEFELLLDLIGKLTGPSQA